MNSYNVILCPQKSIIEFSITNMSLRYIRLIIKNKRYLSFQSMRSNYFIALSLILLSSLSLSYASDEIVFEPHKSLPLDLPQEKKTDKLAIIVTDEAELLGSTYLFKNEPKKYPRILYAKKPFPKNANEDDTLAIPSLGVAETEGKISVHFVEIKELKNPKYGIVGFKQDFFNYFPQGSISTTIEDDEIVNLGPLNKYRTIIYSFLIDNSEKVDLECSYSLDYKGIVRGVYFNDMKRGNWWNGNKGDYTKQHQVKYHERALLKRNQMTVVTIIGYQLEVDDFRIAKCFSKERAIAHPNLNFYYIADSLAASRDYTFKTDKPTVKCAGNATRCLDYAHAITCKPPYVLNGFFCEEFCPPPKLPGPSECVTELSSDTVETLLIEKTKNPNQFYTRAYLDFIPTAKTVFMVIPGPLETYRYSQISGGEYFLQPAFPKKFIKPEADSTWQTYFEMPNDQYCSFTMYYADLETDPSRALLLSDYHGNTPFQYNHISGRYLSLNETVELSHKEGHVISSFIHCDSGCKISIKADGMVKILLDFHKIVDHEFDDFRLIPIDYDWTSLTYLMVDLVASTKFEFIIEGENYYVGTEKVVRGYEPYEMDGCECPLGSYKTKDGCIDNSYIKLTITQSGHSCNYLTLFADINPTEKMLYNDEEYSWMAEAEGQHGELRASKINEYLKTRKSSFVTIPHDLLYKNTNYLFRVSYVNTVGRTIENGTSITLDDVSPSVPLTCFFHFRFWDILSFWPLVILNTVFIPIFIKYYSFDRKPAKDIPYSSNLYLAAIFSIHPLLQGLAVGNFKHIKLRSIILSYIRYLVLIGASFFAASISEDIGEIIPVVILITSPYVTYIPYFNILKMLWTEESHNRLSPRIVIAIIKMVSASIVLYLGIFYISVILQGSFSQQEFEFCLMTVFLNDFCVVPLVLLTLGTNLTKRVKGRLTRAWNSIADILIGTEIYRILVRPRDFIN